MKKNDTKPHRNIGAVILAGGLGTRMQSEIPKALAGLLENPLIFYPFMSVTGARKEFNGRAGLCPYRVFLNKIITVIGYHGELVKKYILNEERFKKKGFSLEFAVQEKYLGTGDAVKKAVSLFSEKKSRRDTKGASAAENAGGICGQVPETDILILPCDMPLMKYETLVRAIKFHLENDNDLTVLSSIAEDPYSYGRILRDEKGFAEKIIEEKELCDYPPETAGIREINSGVYIVKLNLLKRFIGRIKPENRKKEYYFTDIVNIFYKAGLKTLCWTSENSEEFAGVNSKTDLFNAQKVLQKRLINGLISKGVNFISDDGVYIGWNVEIKEGAVIYPGVFISGNTRIFKGATIENGCVVKNSSILDNARINSYSVIENSFIAKDVQIGPFARLRPDTFIGEGSRIGNFVEVKKSVVGKNTKASHLSYIGDSIIGSGVNIGAGVITCNYDGEKKHKTIIDNGCFIGSDSQLVAPVKIGKDSYVGSGTTVTKDVPEGALAVSRVPQQNVEGWALKRKKLLSKQKKKS